MDISITETGFIDTYIQHAIKSASSDTQKAWSEFLVDTYTICKVKG